MTELDLHDMQGIIIRGYGNLPAATFALLRITDAPAARRLLAALAGNVTSALARPRQRAINIAFTYQGLYELGLRADGFAPEFIEGMSTPHRNRILGDAGLSGPEKWLWGARQIGMDHPDDVVHVLVMLYATDDDALGGLLDEARQGWQGCATELQILPAHPLPDRFGVKEHFGFRDGISQPAIAWDDVSPSAERRGVLRADRAENTVAPGEFIFGYRNEYGQLPAAPIVPHDPTGFLPPDGRGRPGFALGRNGTYLVFRQLRQLVPKFWAFVRDAAGFEGGVRLASKMIGRWPSGAPMSMSPGYDPVGLELYRGFDYAHADKYGHGCPLGSHVRRANPRDALLTAGSPEESIREAKRHRLIRRGRTYGPPFEGLDPMRMMGSPDDGIERGLHFIAIASDIERQFEFVQHTWLNNPKFGGLYGHPDPLIGDRIGDFHSFFEQRVPVRRRHTGLASFVRTRGGAYFFLPGIQALRYLGAMPPPLSEVLSRA